MTRPPENAEVWMARAAVLLERAVGEIRDGTDDPLPTISEAEAAVRIAFGELPESELLDLYEEPICTCPPDLVARGGFRSGCPAHRS